MSPMEENMLKVEGLHLGKMKAEKYVKHLANKIGIKIPEGKDYSKDILFDLKGKKVRINFKESIKETQYNGSPKTLQFLSDSQDRYLAPALTLAIGKLPKGVNAKITSSLGQTSKSQEAPAMTESPEVSLANDILYFRKMTCDNSTIENIDACARYFRSYLLSCVSLVDCFLSRYTNVIRESIDDMNSYTNTATLASTSGMEKRIQAWFTTFAYHKIGAYNKTNEWAHFQKLRKKRNTFVHPSEPVTSYSIKEISQYLNYCKKGIGGLLYNFHSYSEQDPNIGFIQIVKTAPLVTFNK